jgi:uncharacterized membrane protein
VVSSRVRKTRLMYQANLNYTPWGITLPPITLSLLALTTAFATAAMLREHQTRTQQRADS